MELMVLSEMPIWNHFDTIKNTITKGMLANEQHIYWATACFYLIDNLEQNINERQFIF